MNVNNFLRNFYWYPPAETKIPWSAIFSAFGKQPTDFKSVLCNYLGIKNCVLAESARALLFKLLKVLKQKDNGQRNEVLIPGYTCYSVAAAVARANLQISVYDIDPATLLPDTDSVRKAISENTLAVVAQHLFGFLTPLDEIKKTASNNGAYLIEDSAQAMGSVKNIPKPGTIGDFGLFSFGRGKPLPVGGGGALVSADHFDVFDTIKFGSKKKGYKQALESAFVQVVSKPYLYWIPEMLPLGLGETVFDPEFEVEELSESVETLLCNALPTLDRLNEHRTYMADVYAANINDHLLIKQPKHASSIIRFPVVLPKTILKKDLKRFGVRRMYPKAIIDAVEIKPFLKENQKPTPGAIEIANRLITLPTHMGISDSTAKDISILVQKTVRQDLQD